VNKIIAMCGLTCSDCGAFIATKTNDNAKRKEVATAWSKMFNASIKPENINCEGCMENGIHFSHCNECETRKCGVPKGIVNCAYCNDYGCERITKFFEVAPEAKTNLEQIRGQKSRK